jgi:hypothetical protein
MSDAKRKEIHENREKYLDSIITAKGNGVTLKKENGLYSIFLSGWVDERPDKVSADTVAQIQAIFDNAIEMA